MIEEWPWSHPHPFLVQTVLFQDETVKSCSALEPEKVRVPIWILSHGFLSGSAIYPPNLMLPPGEELSSQPCARAQPCWSASIK